MNGLEVQVTQSPHATGADRPHPTGADRPRTAGAPGDPEAFARWVEPHWPLMAVLARRLVGQAEWEALLQEALVSAWRARSTYPTEHASPRTWLLTMVADRADTAARTTDGHAALDDPALDRAIGELPADRRLAVDLYYVVGLPMVEIAEVMNCRIGTVSGMLASVRTSLSAEPGEPADAAQRETADINARLSAYGKAFRDATQPPAMAAMLPSANGAATPESREERASKLPDGFSRSNPLKSRWFLPAAAAAVIIAATAMITTWQHSTKPSTTPRPHYAAFTNAVPEKATADGTSWTLVRAVPWRDAWIDAYDIRVIHVVVPDDGTCLAHDVGLIATRGDDTSVTLEAALYRREAESAPPSCGKPFSKQASVTLPEPLEGRSLIDAADGTPRPVRDAATVPAPAFVPEGFVGDGYGHARTLGTVHWVEPSANDADPAHLSRTFTSAADKAALFVSRYESEPLLASSQSLPVDTVLGSAALVDVTLGQTCAVWTDKTSWWETCLRRTPAGARASDRATVLQVANSLQDAARQDDPTGPPSGVPEKIESDGKTLVWAGGEPWTTPKVEGRKVTVSAAQTVPGGCGKVDALRLFQTASDASSATLAAAGYVEPNPLPFEPPCTSSTVSPAKVSMTLPDAFDGRTLVDALTGATHPPGS